jgi:hypothetical protein
MENSSAESNSANQEYLGGCPRIEAVARESGFESAILIIIGSIK